MGWIWRTTGGPTKTYNYTRKDKYLDWFTKEEEYGEEKEKKEGKEFIVYPGCNEDIEKMKIKMEEEEEEEEEEEGG